MTTEPQIEPACIEIHTFQEDGEWKTTALFCGETIARWCLKCDTPSVQRRMKERVVPLVQLRLSQMSAHQRLEWAGRMASFRAGLVAESGHSM